MSVIDYTEKMKKLGPLPEDMRIFWVGKDVARIEAQTPYCLQCIREGREIVAALDDFAQIIGTKVKIVPDDDMEIAKALSASAAVLVDAEQVLNSSGMLPVSGSAMDGKARREKDYVVTTGRDPYEAFVALTVLEKAAEVQILADSLGGVKALPDRIARKLRREYLRKYSKAGRKRRDEELLNESESAQHAEEIEAAQQAEEIESAQQAEPSSNEGALSQVAGDNIEESLADELAASELLLDEFKERRNLVEYGKKLVERKLVQGTWGNLSVRLNDEYMLVTPSGLDYDSLGPEDMVLVNIDTLAYGDAAHNKPTSEVSLHAGIYKNRPDIGAIIHTHSKYCSVFAACQMPIDVMDSYLADEVAGDVIYVSDYATSGTEELASNVVNVLLHGRRGVVMSNHGMVACAADLDAALEVAEAMEEAARKKINARLTKMVNAKLKN